MPNDDGILSELQTNRIAERSPQIPIIVVGQPAHRRLPAGGWFSRGFTGTAGILAAIALFSAVSVVLAAALFLGGLSYLLHQTETDNGRLTNHARRVATPELSKLGVVEISDHAGAFHHDGGVVFAGQGRDARGKLCDFIVKWRVATFNNKESWEWVSVNVNGKETKAK